jgi:hypothetical protein
MCKSFCDLNARPQAINTSASEMPGFFSFSFISTVFMRLANWVIETGLLTISPAFNGFRSGASNILYRTVAIWGRWRGVTIFAMMLPPKAGRICTKPPSDVISSAVQSAVNPVLNRAATLGARLRPKGVAPTNTEEGFTVWMKSSNILA